MISVGVEVDTTELDRALSLAADRFLEDMEKALRACGMLVVRDAQLLAPVRYGKLRQSIRLAESLEVEPDGSIGLDIIAGGSEAFYAPFQEFGTRTIAPKAFMRGALAMHEHDIETILGEAVERSLGSIAA